MLLSSSKAPHGFRSAAVASAAVASAAVASATVRITYYFHSVLQYIIAGLGRRVYTRFKIKTTS